MDREAAEKIRAIFPHLGDAAWANRGFHGRAAIWMAWQGIRQFLDVGCGLPTFRDTYGTVRPYAPQARVVYADHDPAVIAHANALLRREGVTSVVRADVRDPAGLLAALHDDGLLDLAEPVGVLATAVLHFVAGQDDPWGCVARLMAALAPGSYLALSHASGDHLSPAAVAAVTEAFADAGEQVHLRSRAEVGRFFEGLHVVSPCHGDEPGLVHAGLWGCEDPALADSAGARTVYCAVARR